MTILRTGLISLVVLGLMTSSVAAEPLRLAIVGLVHGHVGGFLRQAVHDDAIVLVGVQEAQTELHPHYMERYALDESLFYADLKIMLEETKPEAVAVMTSTYDHAEVVEVCAPLGVHVMMEKPLAVSMEHARAMERAANEHGIHVLVNYETTWYASHHAMREQIMDGTIGEMRRFVVRDGHMGPIEIGCSDEFLAWLTDPVLNGGGALFDFGCYGANLITWLLDNQRPETVTAITQTIKPDMYPNVDDEATILLTYPNATGVIQASWNWPFHRKDIDVYGNEGVIRVPNPNEMTVRQGNEIHEADLPAIAEPHANPLAYLKAVVRGEIAPDGLSSLKNNMIVTEILTAARESAERGETIHLKDSTRQK